MQFSPPLQSGTLIKRYKRFLADIQLDTGEVITAHCANTGAMTGCAEPGFRAFVSYHPDPGRKLAYSWQLAKDNQGHWIGINTHLANKLVEEALATNKITALSGYERVRREVKPKDSNHRLDFMLSGQQQDCYVEVKSVTLLHDGQGYFPDTVTLRGQQHLQELMRLKRLGYRVVLLFCVQHSGIHSVKAASHLDPHYAATLSEALAVGVEVMAWGCSINPEKIELNQQLAFKI
ncbi:DNA/RNA nuclease SfsA [Aliiglaciecola sp. CAU 1673]|uniref:DNA/RNA nuclease SfsA n=1 Tax=Aliiglaciecola sp. CAU 1673 TaxID=3032595 RepID=UPI0023DC812D|nr:DNA/RNA nuclease SfsA [Aliiglaciecola sp. CAU 1673]MDF2177810.1 DNA/RNA nuclease SfsA [Aliiglaciecola sp. CAU 1673]